MSSQQRAGRESLFRRLTSWLAVREDTPPPGSGLPKKVMVFGVEVNEETVARKAKALWPDGEATELLSGLVNVSDSLRVRLGILRLSEGSLDELKRLARVAIGDRRDILWEAETAPEEREGTPEFQLNVGKFRNEHVERYRAWLRS